MFPGETLPFLKRPGFPLSRRHRVVGCRAVNPEEHSRSLRQTSTAKTQLAASITLVIRFFVLNGIWENHHAINGKIHYFYGHVP